jgi:hypothetical protein
VTVNIESEEKCEIDERNGHDDEAGDDPFEAVAEVLLFEEGDRVRLPDHIRRNVWMVRSKVTNYSESCLMLSLVNIIIPLL